MQGDECLLLPLQLYVTLFKKQNSLGLSFHSFVHSVILRHVQSLSFDSKPQQKSPITLRWGWHSFYFCYINEQICKRTAGAIINLILPILIGVRFNHSCTVRVLLEVLPLPTWVVLSWGLCFFFFLSRMASNSWQASCLSLS